MKNDLINEFKQLKEDIKPRPEWVKMSRDILLQQISAEAEGQSVKIGLNGYFNLVAQLFRRRLLEPAVVMLLVLGAFLGSSLTINAAFYSLPGDSLYRVKLALEDTHVALTPNNEKKFELKVEFAEKRVAELDKVMTSQTDTPEAKKEKIKIAISEFKNSVTDVNNQLTRLNQSISESKDSAIEIDREQTVRMAMTASKTVDLTKSVDEKVGTLDDTDQEEVKEMIEQTALAAEETNFNAQKLIDDINKEDAESEDVEEEGIVEGASNEGEAGETVGKEGEAVESEEAGEEAIDGEAGADGGNDAESEDTAGE